MGASVSAESTGEPAGGFADRPFVVSNLGDSASLKRCVDEATAMVVIEQGYEEDHFHSNVRIALGIVACAFAIAAQLPGSFPDNWNLLCGCVVGYLVFSVILNWYSATYEEDVILFTKPKEGSSFGSGLAVTTLMKRYSDVVTIVIRSKDTSVSRESVEETYSVCKWFDVNGVMSKDNIKSDVLKVLRAYESGGLGAQEAEMTTTAPCALLLILRRLQVHRHLQLQSFVLPERCERRQCGGGGTVGVMTQVSHNIVAARESTDISLRLSSQVERS
eukprot:CAMPEP_0177781724 /NCGR_PEP_ID=MMETSP0491_2-20121128/18028_1 /TAXON_ID=63592 /ORGANISM="Tetraselmis chuii, Strain PLY429" /LENGTH=274 /DNA_ID=CAMNT_0019301859 /DNA_START=244 /DNA_END=1063 /DNA_ORIENTATION=-